MCSEFGARTAATIGATVAVIIGSVVGAPPSSAEAPSWCDTSGGSWNAVAGVCTVSVTSPRQATMTISVSMPADLADDATAGPVLRAYARDVITKWRAVGTTMPRDSVATVDYVEYRHAESIRSVVFHEYWKTLGDFPNNAYRTWTFDTARGVELRLADLTRPGVDPLTAIAPLAQPYLIPALDSAAPAHVPGSYPFLASEWEPNPLGAGFSSNYQAFALTGDELVVYMPSAPMAHPHPVPRDQLAWSMDGGAVVMRVPLSALAPVWRGA